MMSKPSIMNKLTRRVQSKVNSLIPEKVHMGITAAIRQMIHGVLFGAQHTTAPPVMEQPLAVRETLITEKINQYRKAAAAEGGITGAGGLLMGLADFPLLIGIKIKLLYSVAALYGYKVNEYKERDKEKQKQALSKGLSLIQIPFWWDRSKYRYRIINENSPFRYIQEGIFG